MNFHTILKNIKEKKPLVHNITNYVTANDCANIILASGASPVMADCPEEAEEITSISQSLCINIGTLNDISVKSMLIAGIRANKLGIPVILDPVGVGASKFRTDTVRMLMDKIHFSVIKGNISEILTLAGNNGHTSGVDASDADIFDKANADKNISPMQKFSLQTGAITVASGMVDIIVSSDKTALVKNGHPMMSRITGSGCMLSSLIAAFAGGNPDNIFNATVGAVVSMGLAGETAAARMKSQDGNSSFRNYLIDAIFNITGDILEKGAVYELK